jgi:hypothetical protein
VDEAAKSPETLGGIPPAMSKGSILVQLSEPVDGRGVVLVEKWSFTKAVAVTAMMGRAFDNLPREVLDDFGKGDWRAHVSDLAAAMGERIIDLVEESVRPEDRGLVRRLTSEDGLDVLTAVFECNLTERFLGKAVALVLRSLKKFAEAARSTR